MARSTVRPPTPESKSPMGSVFILSPFTATHPGHSGYTRHSCDIFSNLEHDQTPLGLVAAYCAARHESALQNIPGIQVSAGFLMPKTCRGSNSYILSGAGEEKYLDKARPLPHNPLKAARLWAGVLHMPGVFNRETICRGNTSLPFQEWEDENFLHPFPPSSRTVNFGNEVCS